LEGERGFWNERKETIDDTANNLKGNQGKRGFAGQGGLLPFCEENTKRNGKWAKKARHSSWEQKKITGRQ